MSTTVNYSFFNLLCASFTLLCIITDNNNKNQVNGLRIGIEWSRQSNCYYDLNSASVCAPLVQMGYCVSGYDAFVSRMCCKSCQRWKANGGGGRNTAGNVKSKPSVNSGKGGTTSGRRSASNTNSFSSTNKSKASTSACTKDKNPVFCPQWAAKGECQKAGWVSRECCKSCRTAPSEQRSSTDKRISRKRTVATSQQKRVTRPRRKQRRPQSNRISSNRTLSRQTSRRRPRTSRTRTSSNTKTVPRVSGSSQRCTNRNSSCEIWAKTGDCQTNKLVQKDCCRSCQNAPVVNLNVCADRGPECRQWAPTHCSSRATIRKYCCLSCKRSSSKLHSDPVIANVINRKAETPLPINPTEQLTDATPSEDRTDLGTIIDLDNNNENDEGQQLSLTESLATDPVCNNISKKYQESYCLSKILSQQDPADNYCLRQPRFRQEYCCGMCTCYSQLSSLRAQGVCSPGSSDEVCLRRCALRNNVL